ncbi:MAG: IPT/TIG domain-containing protein [Acidobacteriaceae bacterium]|nr:IPT/TIG domain-containing protein [Acidobacteriaceae bacterium]
MVTPGGTSGNLTFTTTAPPAPTLTAISPTTGLRGTTVPITLTGTNLGGATVNTGTGSGITATVLSINGAGTSLTANLVIAANAPTGNANISVTTGGGTSGSKTFSVTAPPPPTLTAISPASGTIGTNVNITLTGTNLSTITAVNVGGSYINVSNVKVVDNSHVTATLQINLLALLETSTTVSVTTAGGTSNTVTFGLTVPTL